MMSDPLISCLCITKNNKQLLQRAIECFLLQTYRHKELLIIYESNNEHIKDVLEIYASYDSIRFVAIPFNELLTLGHLRNLSIELSNGTYFCQWDDDDWYHTERLAIQMKAIQEQGAVASFLGRWLMYDGKTGRSYISHKRNWEGTILCKKEIVNQQCHYALVAKQEDTPFMEYLQSHYAITKVSAPWLYIYTYHGNNTWDYPHFEGMYGFSKQLPPIFDALISDILNNEWTIAEGSALLSSDVYKLQLSEIMSLQTQ